MKIRCDRATLNESLNIVSKAVSKHTSLPILNCILLQATREHGFRLVTNDLEIGIETKPIVAEIIEPGELALDARIFSDIVRNLPDGSVYIESMSNYIVSIKSGETEFEILGDQSDNFPSLPDVMTKTGLKVSSSKLKKMIRKTVFSVSLDESRPFLTGELFRVNNGTLTVASTDNHRVSVNYTSVGNNDLNESIIVPRKTLGEIVKILDNDEESVAHIYFLERYIIFETNKAKVLSRVIEGKFIDIDLVLKTECTIIVTVVTRELLDCVERAVLISRNKE